jgi:hypothetical protein
LALLNHSSIRQYVALVDDGRGVVVLACKLAFRVVKAGACLRFQVHAVANVGVIRFWRLAWHKPSAVVCPIQSAHCCDQKAAFFSRSHGKSPFVAVYILYMAIRGMSMVYVRYFDFLSSKH